MAAVVLQWLARFGVLLVNSQAVAFSMISGLVGGLVVVLWWVFFSRAAWLERLGAIAVMALTLFGTSRLLDESIATGMMGMMFIIYVTPVLSLAFVAWAVATRHLDDRIRRATLVATILVACLGWTLVRTGGMTGNAQSEFAWRWQTTPEERLLAQADDDLAPAPLAVATALDPDKSWPGFRGKGRDSTLRGTHLATDWTAKPPVELWRRLIGPGWSSFAVDGDLLFTQEQRGEDEVVACYRASTGEPVWMHQDATRFWESNAGAGPRGTPTLHEGRVYTLGATGLVNALSETDGTVLWSRNAASDTGAELPDWGFSGSPLVVDDLLLVAASGTLIAYDLPTGEVRWKGQVGGESYSSPHLATLGGVQQVLQLRGEGLLSVEPATGAKLFEHEWSGYPIVQPALTPEGDILISVNADSGIQSLAIAQGPDGFTATERWATKGLKPYFNDFVVHEGHAYGFDGRILAAIDVEDGARVWKGGRYGSGQLLLLADQDLLLVLSEQGEIALVQATPDQFTELALFPAIEGKTWNHPVLVGDHLWVRNDQEMAALRLPLEGS